jgi:predicted ATP-grasp superfamily ATP-dependent carboligase
MTTVFVYEYCCALGLGRDPSDPAHSLYREGRAMRDAIAEDFRRIPGTDVLTTDESSQEAHEQEVWRTAEGSDYALVVAPEFDGVLADLCRAVRRSAGRLVGPDVESLQVTADKLELYSHWSGRHISTPHTVPILQWPLWKSPVVFKPQFGAGSFATRLVPTGGDVAAGVRDAVGEYPGRLIAQDFVPGRPASVAFLVGPVQTVPLLPAYQLLSSDGRFRYEGGELPIPPELAERAVSLGRRAIDCVPGLLGYVGVDLVLRDAADESQDYAIEINPRLTTSYIGLRELADFNLAEAVLRVVNGEPVEPRWKPGRVRFRPDGSVSVDPTHGPTSG